LPLVLVEAVASGLAVIGTDLPAVREDVAPHLGDALTLVGLPRLRTVDEPLEEDLPAFVDRLEGALVAGLISRTPGAVARPELRGFTWQAVFERVDRIGSEVT
jgi:glycosyltransferase involved in cell wall biosynthesis